MGKFEIETCAARATRVTQLYISNIRGFLCNVLIHHTPCCGYRGDCINIESDRLSDENAVMFLKAWSNLVRVGGTASLSIYYSSISNSTNISQMIFTNHIFSLHFEVSKRRSENRANNIHRMMEPLIILHCI